MDYSLLSNFVHGIFQARILEWVSIRFSRGTSQPRDRTQVSRVAGRFFTIRATRQEGGIKSLNQDKGVNRTVHETRLYGHPVKPESLPVVSIVIQSTSVCC